MGGYWPPTTAGTPTTSGRSTTCSSRSSECAPAEQWTPPTSSSPSSPSPRTASPESWLVFPIGTLKIASAMGLLLGPVGVPLIGAAAAVGLILYFAIAVAFHLRARDYSPQLAGAGGFFLPLAVATLALDLAAG
ncbi:MAG: DoxX family protein [Thermocrispum sp.]